MNSEDYRNLGDNLRKTINEAINSKNFEKLSGNISDVINSTFNTVQTEIKSTGHTLKNTLSKNNSKSLNTSYPVNKHVLPRGYGIGLTVCGIVGSIFFSLLTAIMLILNIFINSFYAVIPTVLSLCTSVAFYIMTSYGIKARRLKKHFEKYCNVMVGKTSFEIDYLSIQMQQSRKKTIKELQKLIGINAFPQGHIDFEKKYFIADNSTYEYYLSSKELQKNTSTHSSNEQADAVREAISEGRNYIKHIRQANIIILNDDMSNKLDDTEKILTKIFERLESKPELLPDIRKLMEYYLPITQKLINAYIDLDKQDINTDNIVNSKHEIEKSIDSVNTAFFNLYNSLFHDDKVDIISDISVLRSMFAQEGLNDTDFNKKKG